MTYAPSVGEDTKMIEYDARPERAVLVAVLAQGADEERELAEMRELLRTAQVDVVGDLRAAPREHPPAHVRRQRQAQGAEGARQGARGRGRRDRGRALAEPAARARGRARHARRRPHAA